MLCFIDNLKGTSRAREPTLKTEELAGTEIIAGDIAI